MAIWARWLVIAKPVATGAGDELLRWSNALNAYACMSCSTLAVLHASLCKRWREVLHGLLPAAVSSAAD
jgi:hypothetical protein